MNQERQNQAILDAIIAKECPRSFLSFVRHFWPIIEPGEELEETFLVKAICEHLTAIQLRRIRGLIINCPPGFAKSSLVSVLFPAWCWIKQPAERFLTAAYSLQISVRDARRCRSVIDSPQYQRVFGSRFKLLDDQNRKENYANDKTGYRISVSSDSSVLGERFSIALLDDPNNLDKIYSKADRESVWRWYREILLTRAINSQACQVIIQQRSHAEDLTGYLLGNDPTDFWCHLRIPYEYKQDDFPNKINWYDPRKKIGEVISTRRLSAEDLDIKKQYLGIAAYNAQYQQSVVLDEGALFKRKWLRYYDENVANYNLLDKEGNISRIIPKDKCWNFATADLAITTKTSSDYTVIAVFACDPDHNLILLNVVRKKIDGVKLLPTIETLYHDYGLSYIGIEDVAFQKLLVDMARQKGMTVRSLKPGTIDKLARTQPLQIRMENGQFFFPKDKPWMSDVELEVLTYPSSPHDDVIDALAYSTHCVRSRVYQQAVKETLEDKQADYERREAEYRAQQATAGIPD